MSADDDRKPSEDELPDPAALVAEFEGEHTPDIAEALNEQEPETASEVLALMDTEQAAQILDHPELESSDELIENMPLDRAVTLINEMSSDRAAELFRDLEDPLRSEIFERLNPEVQTYLNQLLTYPEDTAGSLMTTEFVSVPSNFTVEQTLDHIRRVERTRETVYAIYVLDPVKKTLLQVVSLRRLVIGHPQASVMSLVPAGRDPVIVAPLTDREEVARTISKYDLLAVPVVDDHGHVLGIVTVDDIIDAILEETTEDVQKFGGVSALEDPYMQIGFFKMIQKRAGWLGILFLSEMLTASAMQHFEGELERAVVLTLFIPLIMSSGGNSGSQATSLIIRALALQEVSLKDWWRVAIRELPTGLVLGAILGVIGMIRIVTWQTMHIYDYGEHWKLIAMTIGASLTGIVCFGSLVGSMLPFLLKRVGFDPASASAPFVATFIDVTGLVIYFTIALLFLRGTML